VTDEKLERLRRTLTAQGIGYDASVSSTLDPFASRARANVDGASALPEVCPGELDPDFEVLGELGRGGMAVVWLAQQLPLAREVAIKRALDPDDEQARVLLLREALITGKLEHPNVVPVHALVHDAQGPAVVLKRLAGSTWDELIQARETSLERSLDIYTQVLNAVAFAHSRGVIHRDIKPANVMIGSYGEIYLLDWGVALQRSEPPSDAIVGTPRYMAPEMVEGVADERTDVFLLGATLHEVLTGEPRHRGESALEVLYATMYVEPFAYSDHVPEELAAICNRACAREPDERYQSADALRAALSTFREHRAANTLSDAAEELLQALEHTLAADEVDYSDVQQRFSQTRFGFEAALRIWSASPSARAGLQTTLCAMIDYELDARHPQAARALLSALQLPDETRSERCATLERELARERERMQAMERDRDPRVGAAQRRRALQLLALSVLTLTLVLLAQRELFPGFRPSATRLVFVGALVLAVVALVVVWWRRQGAWNFVNRRIAEISLSTLAVSFASRLSGFIQQANAESILVADSFILGLGGAALSAYHRAGPWLALLSFIAAVVGSIWPSVIDELYIALSVFVPLAFLLLKKVDNVA
jgi:serine/threonine-protein kinase